MPRIGSGVRPELGRQDWSPVARGGQAFGAGVGAGLQALGAGIGKSIQEQRRKKMEKEQQDSAVSLIMQQYPGTTEDEAKAAVKSVGSANAINFFTAKKAQAQAEELAAERIRQLQMLNNLQERFGAVEAELGIEGQRLGIEGKKLALEQAQFAVDNLDKEWEMKVDEHASRMELNDAQKNKLAWEIHQLANISQNEGIWDIPFEKMTSEMKAAYIFENDLGLSHDKAVEAAFGMEGPSTAEKLEEMESFVVGGHTFTDLWAFTSSSDFKEKVSKDGTTVTLSAGRGANSKSIEIPKSNYDAFKNMREQYTREINTMFEPIVVKLRRKYPEGPNSFNGMKGNVTHEGEKIIFTSEDGERFSIDD